MFKKGQGATEYLIILAVVIIIALIVVGAMGGIPGIGGSASSRASTSYWLTTDIAIPSYAVTASDDAMILDVKNNLRGPIDDLNISMDGIEATCEQTKLAPGQQTNCTVAAVTTCDAGDAYSFNVEITYTDVPTGASYTFTGDGQTLDGKCAN
jgi:hypothetical protein